mgnify:CR=1 FL=1
MIYQKANLETSYFIKYDYKKAKYENNIVSLFSTFTADNSREKNKLQHE